MSWGDDAEAAQALRGMGISEDRINKLLEAAKVKLERERKLGLVEGWVREHMPRVLPVDWIQTEATSHGGFWHSRDGLRVMLSGGVEEDDRRWLHLSCSRTNALPSFKELKRVKEMFLGRDTTAIQVFPRASQYVNIHEYCLHMFTCLDGEILGAVLPDFTMGTGSI